MQSRISVENYRGSVRFVPIYEYVFRLADRMLPASTETTADKQLDCYNRFIFEGQGEQVKIKRLESGPDRGAFSKLYGVNGNTVRRWENGEVRMSRRMWERIFD